CKNLPYLHGCAGLVGHRVGGSLPSELAGYPNVASRTLHGRKPRGLEFRRRLRVILADRSDSAGGRYVRCHNHGIIGIERSNSRAVAAVITFIPRVLAASDCG